ncbi:MAG: M3 family oligoendopeptidase [Phycisphaerales bacterium]|jgi:oligoendopeptidase F|nr:M3 family oligoendopeptidase [Phycisphaerales bacterium]
MTIIATDFVPADLDAAQWENLAPYYQQLLDRELKCVGCLEQLLLDRSELDASASEAEANLYIAMTCDTEDEAIKAAYLAFVEIVEPELKKIGFELDRKVVTSPHASQLDPVRHEVLLRNWQADVDLFREENVPLQTEDTKLGQQYAEICGAMMVEFDGELQTMPQMARYQQETDRDRREAAWRAVAQRRLQDRDAIDTLFDSMISLRGTMAGNAGCSDFREYMFRKKHRFDYTPEDCIAFHDSIEQHCMPLSAQLCNERRASLEVDQLRPWDMDVDPLGRDPLRPFDSAEDMVEKTSRLFARMDEGLHELFESMRGGDSLDLASRKGKAPGGYQYERDRSRRPFIFMNAAGLPRDVDTMVHEAGHAFNSMLCREDPFLWYRHPPLEFAEVASMSMESMAYDFLDEFYGEEDRQRSIRKHLEGIVKVLPWVATIDAFQHWIYTHPTHGRDERTSAWLALEERFGTAVSWDGLEQEHAAMWHRQLHPFEVPFYYVEYGIAQLGALQMWIQYRQDPPRALAAYKRALSLGGSRPLPELFEAGELSLDFTSSNVERLMEAVSSELEALPQ